MAQGNGTATWVQWALGLIVLVIMGLAGSFAYSITANQDKVVSNQKEIAANRASIASLQATLDAVKEDTRDIKALLAQRTGSRP